MKQKISIFGSTGSIGDTVFRLLNKNKTKFKIYILASNKNYKKIYFQIKKYRPKYYIIFDYKTFIKIKKNLNSKNTKILSSKEFKNFKFNTSHISVSAIPGIAGLEPTLKLISLSKKVLIANKESIICGWNLIEKKARKYKTSIFPIDSEHFSVMNLIKGVQKQEIEKIYLTASGGPFLNYPQRKMKKIKPSQAVKHPKWKMGKKISIDSATLMNKLFEVIEAHKLFSIDLDKIDILIHPQSLVHAIIKFKNGLHKFLYFETDMSIPIGNALFNNNFNVNNLGLKNYSKNKFDYNLNFSKVNIKKFPAIKLKPILNKYVSIPIVLNAANEIFVDQFLKKKISFYSIINYLSFLLKDPKLRKYAIKKPTNLKTILVIDKWVRNKAMEIVNRKTK